MDIKYTAALKRASFQILFVCGRTRQVISTFVLPFKFQRPACSQFQADGFKQTYFKQTHFKQMHFKQTFQADANCVDGIGTSPQVLEVLKLSNFSSSRSSQVLKLLSSRSSLILKFSKSSACKDFKQEVSAPLIWRFPKKEGGVAWRYRRSIVSVNCITRQAR